jgi:hypothetical protein
MVPMRGKRLLGPVGACGSDDDPAGSDKVDATVVHTIVGGSALECHNPAGAVIVREDGTVAFRGGSAHSRSCGPEGHGVYGLSLRSSLRAHPDLSEAICADRTERPSARAGSDDGVRTRNAMVMGE